MENSTKMRTFAILFPYKYVSMPKDKLYKIQTKKYDS